MGSTARETRARPSPATSAAVHPAPQRCACGGVKLDGGECASCRARRLAREAAVPEIGHDLGRVRLFPLPTAAGETVVPVAPSHDPYEREAERMSDRALRMPRREPASQQGQRPATTPARSGPGGEPLPETTRSFFEHGFGRGFGNVRVHTDAKAARLSQALNADAFTYGHDIYFNEGRWAPHSTRGRQLIAHELAHTVQQRGAIGRRIQRREVCDENGVCRSEPDPVRSEEGPQMSMMPPAPVAGASLLPPGDCTPGEHRILQNEVDRACDRDTRCTQNDDCPTLWRKIGYNAECIRARATINARCFRGGNIGHIIALVNAINGLGRCWVVYDRQCRPQQPPPVRAPEPAPQTERRPVVDRSFMDRMAAITGLTGTALVIYLIVSEGTRLFPPRNLIPVP